MTNVISIDEKEEIMNQDQVLINASLCEKNIKSYLSNYARKRGFNDYSIVEDVYQNSLIRAIKYIHTYNAKMPFSNWFFRIAVNTLCDQIKKDHKNHCNPGSLLLDKDNIDNMLSFNDKSLQFVDENSIVNHINNRLTIEKAIKILETLPPTLREPLYRLEFNGDSYDEVAQDLGISVAALRVRICRAKKIAREKAGVLLEL